MRRYLLLTLSTMAGALARGLAGLRGPRLHGRRRDGARAGALRPRARDRAGPARARSTCSCWCPARPAARRTSVPVARDIVAGLPGWKVWSVDRRENLLEDHSVLGPVVARQRPARDAFRYYLESITDTSISPRFAPVAERGLRAPLGHGRGDPRPAQRRPRRAARRPHRRARRPLARRHDRRSPTPRWDFGGRAGAEDLAGLVLIDGGSGGPPVGARRGAQQLEQLAASSPFLDLSGLGLPWAIGVLNAVGSTLAVQEPDAPAVLAAWPLAARRAAAAGAGHQRRRLRLRDRRRHRARRPGARAHAHRRPRRRRRSAPVGRRRARAPSRGRPGCSPASRGSTARPGTTRAG